MKSDPLGDTQEFMVPPPPPESAGPRVACGDIEVRIGAESHLGMVRANNEDCYYVARFERSLETLLTNVPDDYLPPRLHEVGYGMLVADGMGGAAAGEVASRSSVQTLLQLVNDTPDWIFAGDDAHFQLFMARMEDRFREIDRLLVRKASADPNLAGMGTTLTLAVTFGFDAVVCHIGDSRAYLFRGGVLRQLTRDMTIAQELLDAGLLGPAEKKMRRLQKMLTQCLGLGNAKAQVERHLLAERDRLLLCSDGLTDMLNNADIAEVLGTNPSPESAAHRLVQLALNAGGHDNVTVIVADYLMK